VDAVADQKDQTPAAGPQQPRGLARILDGVARSGLDQQRRLRHTASESHPAHDLGFRHRPVTAAREQQQRRGTLVKQADPMVKPPGQSRQAAAAEHDNGIGFWIGCSPPLTLPLRGSLPLPAHAGRGPG
jgi:hypothetical protein